MEYRLSWVRRIVLPYQVLLTSKLGFTSKKYPSECRLEASHFIRLLCHSSVLTLQMFISYVSPPIVYNLNADVVS